MKDLEKLTVTKLDSAEVQINTAINLFFSDKSGIAVHTLASAALGILFALSKVNRGRLATEDESRIRPEYVKLWRKKTREAANFFKHADSDASATLRFTDQLNDYKLLQGCFGFYEVAGRATAEMDVFLKWFQIYYPHLFRLNEDEKARLEDVRTTLGAGGTDRRRAKSVGLAMLKGHTS